jgi:catechol 2,3-dioxygenase-like lactoylglutathione lyase family enzyme
MHVVRLGHAGLTVTDLQRSLDFYVGVLGFETRSRRVIDQPWLARLLGLDHASVDAVDLAVPKTNEVIQLFEVRLPLAVPVDPVMTSPGSVHLSFTVEDLEGLTDRLAEAGWPPIAPPVVITSGANTGGLLVCVRDPDGVVVEFFEAPSRPVA